MGVAVRQILQWQEVCGEFRCDATTCLKFIEHQRASNLENFRYHFGLHQTISMKDPLMLLVSVLDEEKNASITGFEVVYRHRPNEIFGYRDSCVHLMFLSALGESRQYFLFSRLKLVNPNANGSEWQDVPAQKQGLSSTERSE